MSYSRSLTKQRRELAVGQGPTVTPTTTYAGVHALPFVAPALKLASTLQNNWVRQIDGIQNKAVISNLSSSTDGYGGSMSRYITSYLGWNDRRT